MWEYFRSLRRNHAGFLSKPIRYVDPLFAGRHPFQTYMLALCLLAGLPYLFGQATAEAVEKQLPLWIAYGWGISLVIGAAVALLGSQWRWEVETGLTLERLGLFMTGVAAVIYFLCILAARSPVAPLLAILIWVGVYLLQVPIPSRFRHQRTIEDALTVLGLVVITSSSLLFLLTPVLSIAAAAAIILGFGLACLRRSRDIARVIHRANEMLVDKASIRQEA